NTIDNTEREYGTFENVLLTPEEYANLKAQFSDFENKINYLSQYMKSTGKNYDDHYATICLWAEQDKGKAEKDRISSTTSYDLEQIKRDVQSNTEIRY
ncbi:MAG: hypothetical protein K2G22_00740, partial [Eubacterium sp.]|nr:hypothetical protein [Eubacterium sp.]